MSTRKDHSALSTQMLGAAGLVIVIGVCALLVAVYQKTFINVVHVTVTSDRAGLLLDPGTRVRVSGVPVGEVRSSKLRPDGTVAIDVALDADKARSVPGDVTARIEATTVFGAKFIDLSAPPQSARSHPIAAGDTIRSAGVTVEANDVFAHAMDVLTAVDPADLNSTLTSTATALRGRGAEIGDLIAAWNSYLTGLEPHLDELDLVLRTAPEVLATYADAAPGLIATADNFGETGMTLVENKPELDALLTTSVTSAHSATSFLQAIYAPLTSFNQESLPVTSLLAEYSPEFGCIINELHKHGTIGDKLYGNEASNEHYLYATTGFLPGQAPYTLAQNRPKLLTGVGPACYPDATAAKPTRPHVRFNDGTKDVYDDAASGKSVSVPNNPLDLYGATVSDWLGKAGFTALLQDLLGAKP